MIAFARKLIVLQVLRSVLRNHSYPCGVGFGALLPPPPAVTVDTVLATQRKLNPYGITSIRVPGSYRGEFFQALNAILMARREEVEMQSWLADARQRTAVEYRDETLKPEAAPK